MIYTTGTATALIGTSTVIGANTVWEPPQVIVGSAIKFNGSYKVYDVSEVISETCITLNVPLSGSNVSGGNYQITKDFTPNKLYREIWREDRRWPTHLTDSLKSIDSHLHTGTVITSMHNTSDLGLKGSTGVKMISTVSDWFSFGTLGRFFVGTETAIAIEVASAITESATSLASCIYVGKQPTTPFGKGTFLLKGIIRNNDWTFQFLGQPIYMSSDAGLLTQTFLSGDYYNQRVGVAITKDTMLFEPDFYLTR